MSSIEGIPPGLAGAEQEAGSVWFAVDEALYPLDAIYGAAYVFIDRCHIFLDRAAPGQVRVSLAPKKVQDAEGLRGYLGEFANELLSCAWRSHITRENRVVIESVTVGALSGAMGPKVQTGPSLDDLASFDFSNQPFEDPLGIAVSWEKKEQERQQAKTTSSAVPGEGGEPK